MFLEVALVPGWTAARQRWLEALDADPDCEGEWQMGPVKRHCALFGWTGRHGLTDEGRQVLTEWRAEGYVYEKPIVRRRATR